MIGEMKRQRGGWNVANNVDFKGIHLVEVGKLNHFYSCICISLKQSLPMSLHLSNYKLTKINEAVNI